MEQTVDGGASYTCAEGDASADCMYSKDDDYSWETSRRETTPFVVTLTKLGVGEEDDRVIATVTTYADTA